MLPAEFADDPDVKLLADRSNDACVTIVHMINRRKAASRDSKDYEFSRRSVDARWNDGLADAEETLEDERFLHRRMPPHSVEVLDLTRK